jgi:signal peptidase I
LIIPHYYRFKATLQVRGLFDYGFFGYNPSRAVGGYVGNGLNRKTAKAVGAAFIAALFLKGFVFDFMFVEGSSMEPGLMPGQVVMVSRLAYGIRVPFQVRSGGRYLVRWRMPSENDVVVFWTPLGALAVKRISALLPGERFIALGDNALQSYDSRSYGPATLDNIVGKVITGK